MDGFHANDHVFSHADLVGRDQPVVAARASDTAFATCLAGYDNDADVDTLPIAAWYEAIRGLSNQARTYPERTNIHCSKYLLNL